MKKPQFSLKTLVFVVTLAAVLLGWWVDHKRLSERLADVAEELKLYKLLEEFDAFDNGGGFVRD